MVILTWRLNPARPGNKRRSLMDEFGESLGRGSTACSEVVCSRRGRTSWVLLADLRRGELPRTLLLQSIGVLYTVCAPQRACPCNQEGDRDPPRPQRAVWLGDGDNIIIQSHYGRAAGRSPHPLESSVRRLILLATPVHCLVRMPPETEAVGTCTCTQIELNF